MQLIIWLGIVVTVAHAAMFSGLNLAVFSLSRLRLEIEAGAGNAGAVAVRELRRDSNFTLATILWGGVATDVLITLLSKSVLNGVLAFLFSTVVITCLCEIAPQAYFSRHALRMAARLAPALRVYGMVLYPVSRPTALLLDLWLGREPTRYLRERDFRALIAQHVKAPGQPEVSAVEGTGAVNFLELDDIPIANEGEELDPRSVLTLPARGNEPVFPAFARSPEDPFLRHVHQADKKWVIVADPSGTPCLALNAHRFLRDALFAATAPDPRRYAHRPVLTRDPRTPLGDLVCLLPVRPRTEQDDVVDDDVILLWGEQKRIVTGADLLGRLLRGIAQPQAV
jgi:metal transporter CNNM